MLAKLKNIRGKMKQHTYLFNLSSPEIYLPTTEDVRKYRDGRMFNEAFYKNEKYSRFLDNIIKNLDINSVTIQELSKIREKIREEESRMNGKMPEGYVLSKTLLNEKAEIIRKKPVWCIQEDRDNISVSPDKYKATLALCRKCFQLWPASASRDLVFIADKEGIKISGPLCESCSR